MPMHLTADLWLPVITAQERVQTGTKRSPGFKKGCRIAGMGGYKILWHPSVQAASLRTGVQR